MIFRQFRAWPAPGTQSALLIHPSRGCMSCGMWISFIRMAGGAALKRRSVDAGGWPRCRAASGSGRRPRRRKRLFHLPAERDSEQSHTPSGGAPPLHARRGLAAMRPQKRANGREGPDFPRWRCFPAPETQVGDGRRPGDKDKGMTRRASRAEALDVISRISRVETGRPSISINSCSQSSAESSACSKPKSRLTALKNADNSRSAMVMRWAQRGGESLDDL